MRCYDFDNGLEKTITIMKEEIINGIKYRLDEENLTAEVIRKDEYKDCIIIPEAVVFNELTYRVTSIGMGAFYGCESLTAITIPNSITIIEDSAFHHCKKLSSITIPESVEIIGDSAFAYCESLKVIAIPNSVKYIGDRAFFCCSSLAVITFQGAAPWMKGIGLGDNWHFGSPAKITIGNIMLLIPGIAFTTSLRDIINGDTISGLVGISEATIKAIAIAIGFALVLVQMGGAL